MGGEVIAGGRSQEGTRMVKANSSLGLRVEVGGGSQVGHVGLWLLGRFADRLRVGEVLSEAFGSSGVVHDRGRLLEFPPWAGHLVYAAV